MAAGCQSARSRSMSPDRLQPGSFANATIINSPRPGARPYLQPLMNGVTVNQTAPIPASLRLRLLLLVLFFGSGCAALIYEIVWFQLLQLVIGSSAVSLGILLGVF